MPHHVLITTHQSFLTDEALTEIARFSLKNMDDFEKAKVLENEVTA